MTIMI